MSGRVRARFGWIVARARPAALVAAVAACATAAPPSVPPEYPPETLRFPDSDQVCASDTTRLWVHRPDQILSEVDRAAFERAMPRKGAGADEPVVDVAVNHYPYERGTSVHLSRTNIPPDQAAQVVSLVRTSLSPPTVPLRPLRVRLRVTRSPLLELSVLPAERCSPHIQHAPGQLPSFGEGVTVREGRGWGLRETPGLIAVALLIDRDGKIESIVPQAGDESVLPAVKETLRGLSFSPALVGNEPVTAELVLVFRYPAVAAREADASAPSR